MICFIAARFSSNQPQWVYEHVFNSLVSAQSRIKLEDLNRIARLAPIRLACTRSLFVISFSFISGAPRMHRHCLRTVHTCVRTLTMHSCEEEKKKKINKRGNNWYFIVLFHWRITRKNDERGYRFSRCLIILTYIIPAASFVFHLLQILIKIY